MKKLEFIIKSEHLEDLKTILTNCNTADIMISNIKDYNNEKGYKKICRGTEYTSNLLRRVKAETIATPEVAELILDKVLQEVRTGNYKDGQIFINDIENVLEICAV